MLNWRLYAKNCSHSTRKWFQPNSFGKLCHLWKSFIKMQLIQTLKIQRAPSWNQWVQIPCKCAWGYEQNEHSRYSLNVNEWKFHSPKEWNSCKPLKKEWFCTLNSKFPLIWSENDSKKSEFPLVWGLKRRTILFRVVLRLTPQMSGNSLFLEWFSLFMSGNLLFNVQNHSFLSGLQEFHSIGEWNFHSFTFRE